MIKLVNVIILLLLIGKIESVQMRHPSIFDNAMNIRLVQQNVNTADQLNEGIYGHISLETALGLNQNINCGDERKQYQEWLRTELDEWIHITSDKQKQIDKYGQLQQFQEALENTCNDIYLEDNNNLIKITDNSNFPRGDKKSEDLEPSSIYTYQKSCINNLIEKVNPENLDKDDNDTCRHLLKTVDDLVEQLEYIKDIPDQQFNTYNTNLKKIHQEFCCDDDCQTCEGPDAGDCIECKEIKEFKKFPPFDASNSEADTKCQCKDGFFKNDQGNCEKCNDKCQTCENLETCLVCAETRENREPDCECLTNEFDDLIGTKKCVKCNYTCLTCVGSTKDECTECPTGRGKTLPTGPCNVEPGHYEVPGQGPAPECHYSCEECEFPNEDAMPTTCTDGNCFPDGQPINDEVGRNACIICSADRKRVHEPNTQLDSQGQCLCKTVNGLGFDKLSDPQCQECHYTCKFCERNENNESGQDDCSSCADNRDLTVVAGQNTFSCPCSENHFDPSKFGEEKELNQACQPCHNTCKGCTGPNIQNCKECKTGMSIVNFVCKCDVGITTQDGNCEPCHATCGQTNCTGTKNNECKEDCPENRTYENGFCKADDGFWENDEEVPGDCNEDCKTCEGSFQNQCITCNDELKEVPDPAPKKCQCLSGYYEDENNDCQLCEPTAQTCDKDGPILCKGGRDVDQTQNKCLCPIGTLSINDSIECVPCDADCVSCKDQDNNCTDCKTDIPNSLIEKGQCLCPDTQFYNEQTFTCEQCHLFCETCNGTLETDCLVPKDQTAVIPHGCNKHHVFIIENSTNNAKSLASAQKGINSVGDLFSYGVERWINEKIKIQEEEEIFSDMSFILYGSTSTVTKSMSPIDEILTVGDLNAGTDSSANFLGAVTALGDLIQELPADDDNQFAVTILYNSKLDNEGIIEGQLQPYKEKIESLDFISINLESPLIKTNLPQFEQVIDVQNLDSTSSFLAVLSPEPCDYNEDQLPICIDDNQYFNTTENKCKTCATNCLKCKAPGDNCTDCTADKILIPNTDPNIDTQSCGCAPENEMVDGVCLLRCQEKQYRDMSDKVCKDCSDQCGKACKGPTVDDCLDCEVGKYLETASGVNNGKCLDCHFTCAVCEEDICSECVIENAEKDTNRLLDQENPQASACICNIGYMEEQNNDNVECQIICEDGFVNVDNECKQCHPHCKTCTGIADNECVECADGGREKPGNGKNTCDVPEGTYVTPEDDIIVKPCDKNCKTCKSEAENCTQCHNNTLFTLTKTDSNCNIHNGDECNHTCVCNVGYIQSLEDPTVCQECNETCKMGCSEQPNVTTGDACIDCQSGRTLNTNPAQGEEYCPCNEGLYPNGPICSECHVTCKTCTSELRTNCVDCYEEELGRQKTVAAEEISCEPKDNYYENDEKIPGKCNIMCLTCNGPNANECLTCYESENFVRSDKDAPQSECITKDGFHPVNPEPQENTPPRRPTNKQCHHSCKTCTDATEACEECIDGRADQIPNSKHCPCPEGSYDEVNSANSNKCEDCHYSCKTCKGPQAVQCEECKENDNRIKKEIGSNIGATCNCATGYYEESEQCVECSFKCSQCTSLEVCTQCASVNRDLDSCDPSKGYTESNEPEPTKCHYTCMRCEGTEANDCTECNENEHNREFIQNDDNEKGTCPPKAGWFDPLNETPVTKPCHYHCATCNGGTKEECSECSAVNGFVEQEDENSSDSCQPKPEHYDDPTTQQAEPCHPSCKKCTEKTENDCKVCTWEDNLLDLTDRESNTCEPPKKFYHEVDDETKEPHPCDINCKECKDEKDKCTDCYTSQNFQLQSDDTCDCANGHYLNENGGQQECLKCGKGCKKCDETECFECIGVFNKIIGQVCDCLENYDAQYASYDCVKKVQESTTIPEDPTDPADKENPDCITMNRVKSPQDFLEKRDEAAGEEAPTGDSNDGTTLGNDFLLLNHNITEQVHSKFNSKYQEFMDTMKKDYIRQR